MKRLEIIFLCVAVVVLLIPVVAYVNVTGQQEAKIYKVFYKDLCASENVLLDDLRYVDGDLVAHDSVGCPKIVKTVSRWDDLSEVNQVIITSRLTSLGYSEGEIVREIGKDREIIVSTR